RVVAIRRKSHLWRAGVCRAGVCSIFRGMPLEERINKVFGDDEPSHFGSGWWSGVLSAFFGILAFGAVLCLHFPQVLSSPELRPYYPMYLIRLLIQVVIGAA